MTHVKGQTGHDDPILAAAITEVPVYSVRRQGTVSLLEIASAPLRHWRVVLVVPLLAGLVAAGVSFLVPPTFRARTAFAPESRTQSRLPTGLAGVAGQIGIPLGIDASQSPRFYAEVVKSRDLSTRILLSSYGEDSATLLRTLEVNGDNALDSLENGLQELSKLVSVQVDNLTNIVTLTVDAPYPALAAAVANRYVDYLNEFNAKNRRSQARVRRQFVEERIADGARALERAEDDLRRLHENNRQWQQAPSLVIEEQRLRRQINVLQEVYLTLRREYETARIEEVNDTPAITVIDPAVAPQQRFRPRRSAIVLSALVFGSLVSVLWAYGLEYVDRARREQEEGYLEFAGLLRRVRREMRQSLRALVRKAD